MMAPAARDEQRMAALHYALVEIAWDTPATCANAENRRWTQHRYCGCVRCDIAVVETYHGWTRGERKDGRRDPIDGPLEPRPLLHRARRISNLIAAKHALAPPFPGPQDSKFTSLTLANAFRGHAEALA